MKALLDTDTLSEVFKLKNSNVTARSAAYRTQWGRYTLSSVTVMEVIKGFSRKGREDQIKRFIAVIDESEVLPLDRTSGELAGRIYSDLERAGLLIGVADVMIAAIAIHHGLPLATGNTSDYARIQEVGYSLMIENWRDPAI
jgi:predicted nucleic acid-binding protein